MKFSIQEINKAWMEFNNPMFSVSKGSKFISDPHGCALQKDMQPIQVIRRTDFISFLISWKENKRKK